MKASSEKEIRKLVHGVIAHLQKDANGVKPGPKDMDTAMQVVQQWMRATGLRGDDQRLSVILKAKLAL